ncbi:STM3941 family protein [Anaerococcus cruorum]|uniref:STM3941 family protein n=1 Tax=Anaerococcus sp. WGS1596 TaxID=3366806 RepID=UPI00372D3006
MKNSLINWNSVDRIEYMPLMNQGMISIFLKDEKMYLDKLSLLKKSLTKINIAMGYGEITINMNQIQNMNGIKLAETMNEYLNIHHN